MSKLIFSTLSILALLLSGTNCSTGIRGGGGGSQIDGLKRCTVGLELNPGDECSGSDYSFLNNAGLLIPKGSYFDSNGYVHVHGETIDKSTGRTSPGYFKSGDLLHLIRNDKAWTIKSLP